MGLGQGSREFVAFLPHGIECIQRCWIVTPKSVLTAAEAEQPLRECLSFCVGYLCIRARPGQSGGKARAVSDRALELALELIDRTSRCAHRDILQVHLKMVKCESHGVNMALEGAPAGVCQSIGCRQVSVEHDMLLAERDELRDRVRELAAEVALLRAALAESQQDRRAAAPSSVGSTSPRATVTPPPPSNAAGGPGADPSIQPAAQPRPPEPSGAQLRALLRPGDLLDELGWPGREDDLGLPIPRDVRGILDAAARERIAVVAGEDEIALRDTLCSVLDRAVGPLALSVVCDESATAAGGIVNRLQQALPQVEVVRVAPLGAHQIDAGEELPWGWPEPIADIPTLEVAYLLPGLPPEGSGGSHSLVQEARGLRVLGTRTRICVPAQALARASELYGNADELFTAYESEAAIPRAIGAAAVVVATEYISVRPLELVAEQHPELLFAYYVQDYEPLFAPVASARADGALLSYKAIPGMLLFAKTHWLRNLVAARHDVPVAKVRPSLDQELFHARGRTSRQGPARVAAMVRPRTPRRRALATLAALVAIAEALGERVEVVSFGCDATAFAELRSELDIDSERVTHMGLLSRAQVAELMRGVDVFIDASAYQAFGRTGLEAMACGAIPVLPALGGVGEYAVHEHNALVLARDTPTEIAGAVCSLLADDARQSRLRAAGLGSAVGFSIELAARSQLQLFTAAAARRTESVTVPA